MAIPRDFREPRAARRACVLLALCFTLISSGCGRIGFDLTSSEGPSGDGDGAGDGGDGGGGGQGGSAGDTGVGAAGGQGGASGAAGAAGTAGEGGAGGSAGDPDGGVGGDGPPDDVVVCVLDSCSDEFDRCPQDPNKTSPGICGCGVSDDANEDGDNMPDCIDYCDGKPDVLPDGSCGCAAAAADNDGDGVSNCMDWCPTDLDKTEPGVCGCAISEADDDGDGMPTCADVCYDDPEKVVAGDCGCGVVESDLDTDDDDILDCVDACSGLNDASYVPVDDCGVGYCHDNNTASTCVSGVETQCIAGGALSSDDATCDLVDDDCDGTRDEDYPSTPSTCGVGACARAGTLGCVSGTVFDDCVPGTPAAGDATCDGIDDDCDTNADESFVPRGSTCGVGACAATGTVTCAGGAEQDSCTPLAGAASDATCDGVDDDCDGQTDEDYGDSSTTCGTGACAQGGQLTCVSGSEVDSCTPSTGAADDTSCNGVDDDCDGQNDENYPVTATSCGTGLCAAAGQRTCVNGSTTDSCTPGTPAANDATCNGIDNDCDGRNDEDYVVTATSCGVGACGATGQLTCVNGSTSNSCTPGTPAANDASCNGIDDDCSGQRDEDYVATPTSCGVGACARTGSLICSNGSTSNTCSAGSPTTDNDCDGVDDDCDGSTDEHYVPTMTSCGVGACGRTGMLVCMNGSTSNTCMPGAPAANDTSCNDTDDDCDGLKDEDYVQAPTSCGVGACTASGHLQCVAGVVSDTCMDGSAQVDNDCDGVDDDCDGSFDEHFVSSATACGVGACARTGTLTCSNGVTADSCAPGTPAANDATCDGIDQDCNGQADEDYVVTATSCGVGACGRTGQLTCVNGSTSNSCTPGTPAANDASCDGIDQDCNGTNDEDYVVTSTNCGVGACAATGSLTCVNGTTSNSCTPGTPAASDTTCNGIDDNCNGAKDEGYVVTTTNCGVGACAATGSLTCVNGSTSDSCTAGTPGPSDTSCDGIDQNCNGTKDEGYVATMTNCGVGACARTGMLTCANGSTSNSCMPGTPAASDTTCNNVDDNCNGTKDEGYVVTATSCGTGVCASTGQNVCIAGAVTDTCMQGSPTSSVDDPTYPGNGLDNDCDGTVDEDSVPPCSAPDTVVSATGLQNITVPAGCANAIVRLWGAGGAAGSGGGGYWGSITGGAGGPGGFSQRTFAVTSSTSIYVRLGQAGQGCGGAGSNNDTTGSPAVNYSGGAGSTSRNGNGTVGQNNVNPAGGSGGAPSGGGDGGKGFFGGGGGGGGGGPAWNPFGPAGGGGAASVISVGGTKMVAGGGGGGGGAGSNITSAGEAGGAGGSGCSGAGTAPSTNGGGGGGGGKCDGTTTQKGTGRNPYVPAGVTLPGSTAKGGDSGTDCSAGGNGYLIIDWTP